MIASLALLATTVPTLESTPVPTSQYFVDSVNACLGVTVENGSDEVVFNKGGWTGQAVSTEKEEFLSRVYTKSGAIPIHLSFKDDKFISCMVVADGYPEGGDQDLVSALKLAYGPPQTAFMHAYRWLFRSRAIIYAGASKINGKVVISVFRVSGASK